MFMLFVVVKLTALFFFSPLVHFLGSLSASGLPSGEYSPEESIEEEIPWMHSEPIGFQGPEFGFEQPAENGEW